MTTRQCLCSRWAQQDPAAEVLMLVSAGGGDGWGGVTQELTQTHKQDSVSHKSPRTKLEKY